MSAPRVIPIQPQAPDAELEACAAAEAFALMVLLMRRQAGLPLTLLAGGLAAMVGYGVLMWAGRRWGLPV